uniref:Protein S100 n=1 Tax=Kryptolebias marmoratus TaxID=37003 RepID=A0A3Q3ESU2_KRYMA
MAHQNPTQLETALCMLINVFEKYAKQEGKKDTLTKKEAKTLLEKELPGMAGKNSDDGDKLLESLDSDGDNEIDFKEFSVFVICLLCCAHNNFFLNEIK